MKKTFLILATALTSMGAAAFDLAPRHVVSPMPANIQSIDVELPAARVAAPARAAEETLSMDFSPAYDPYQALGFNGVNVGTKYGQAFEFTKANAETFAGNTITDIYFWTGVNSSTGINNIRKATVFLADDIDQEPFFTQQVELPSTRFTPVKVHLDTPYEITADKKIFVGTICAISAVDDYPIVVDYMYHGTDDCGGWIGIQAYGTKSMSWDNYASQVGFVTIGVTIQGDKLPTDMVSIDNYFVSPVVNENEGFELDILLTNNAANTVNNVDIEVQVGDQPAETVNIQFQEPLSFKGQDVIALTGLAYPTPSKDVPVKATITKINGNDNNDNNKGIETSIAVVDPAKSFNRSVVIEEFTGIWCGYCPVGIVAMDYIRENNNNYTYIPVAIHYEDALSAASFSKVISNYCGGSVPSAYLNRWQDSYPSLSYGLLDDIEFVASIPAIANVNATAHFDVENKKIQVDTETQFSFDYTDGDKNFILSYAITEDNVGPYDQHNYYTGTNDVPGWGNRGEYYSMMYYDVARQLDKYSGITGSVPANITSGETYTFSHTISASSAIKDLNNCNVVVYLTNVKTGVIENACWLTKDNNYSGVEEVNLDGVNADAPVEYYNLQGIRVVEPSNGIFIRRQGNSTTKVLIK